MMKSNEEIKLHGTEAIEILKQIECILISLHNIGSYYSVKYHDGVLDKRNKEYEIETTRFIDEWKITHKLAKAREILSKKYDDTLGEDDMDDLERAMESVKYWNSPGDKPNS